MADKPIDFGSWFRRRRPVKPVHPDDEENGRAHQLLDQCEQILDELDRDERKGPVQC